MTKVMLFLRHFQKKMLTFRTDCASFSEKEIFWDENDYFCKIVGNIGEKYLQNESMRAILYGQLEKNPKM